MASIEHITVNLRAHTRVARSVLIILTPLVRTRLLSVDRAIAFAMRFVRVEARSEGWGGD